MTEQLFEQIYNAANSSNNTSEEVIDLNKNAAEKREELVSQPKPPVPFQNTCTN